jgi:hypothetical protein
MDLQTLLGPNINREGLSPELINALFAVAREPAQLAYQYAALAGANQRAAMAASADAGKNAISMAQLELQRQLGIGGMELDKQKLDLQRYLGEGDLALGRDKLALLSQQLAADNTFRLANFVASLRGPRNAFTQQAVLHGLNSAGLSNAVDAISKGTNLPGFQADQGTPEPATPATFAEDTGLTVPGGPGQTPGAGASPADQANQAALDANNSPEYQAKLRQDFIDGEKWKADYLATTDPNHQLYGPPDSYVGGTVQRTPAEIAGSAAIRAAGAAAGANVSLGGAGSPTAAATRGGPAPVAPAPAATPSTPGHGTSISPEAQAGLYPGPRPAAPLAPQPPGPTGVTSTPWGGLQLAPPPPPAPLINEAPSYDVGTFQVPETGPAILHEGEAVLPANVASDFRAQPGVPDTGPVNPEAGGLGTGAPSGTEQMAPSVAPPTAAPVAPAAPAMGTPSVRGPSYWGDLSQQYLSALPAPNQIVGRNWLRLPESTRSFMLGGYEAKGYDPNDILWMVQNSLPGKAAWNRPFNAVQR